MASSIQRLAELESEVRDLIVEVGHESFASRVWYQLVAALDNIGDTTLALKSYQRAGLGRTSSAKYLRLFGLLQCIYMQQDSIRYLYIALLDNKLSFDSESAWARIRELRNWIGGHPAERGGAVARVSIERTGFQVMQWNSKRDAPKFQHVDFASLYAGYKEDAISALVNLRQALLSPNYRPPPSGERSG